MSTTYRITIIATYKGEGPDPSALLDSYQDDISQLSPHDEEITDDDVAVSVEEVPEGTKAL